MVQFLLKHLLKQRFLAVHHGSIDFGVGSRSQKFWKGQSPESQILETLVSESDILPPTLQPCYATQIKKVKLAS